MNQSFFHFGFAAILLGLLLCGRVGLAQTDSSPASGSLFEGIELNDEHITAGAEFVVPGEFSIATPTGGFEWKELSNADTETLSGKWYTCTKQGHKGGLVLGIEMRTAESDVAKLETIARHYNVMLTRLDQRGFIDPKVKKPSLETPVPDRIDYEIAAKTPAGQQTYMLGATIFGGRVFSFQIATESRQEAKELLAIVKTFKDLSPPIDPVIRGEVDGDKFVVPGQFAITLPGDGFQWALAQTAFVNGARVPTYICTKEGEPSSIVLAVQSSPEGTDAELRQLVQKQFETLGRQLKAGGFSDIQERAPDTKSNTDRLSYAFRGKDREGVINYVFGLTVFGRRLYTLHLVSPSQDEARRLHQALNSFKELPAQ